MKSGDKQMQILKLDIDGYRSLRKVSWEPGPLNVIIGPNGAGKSNLLRLLELLATSARGQLGKYIQDSGGMDPLVWDGISEGICIAVKTSPVEQGRGVQSDSLTYELQLQRVGKGSAYRIGHEQLAKMHDYEQGRYSKPLLFLERNRSSARIFDDTQRELVAPEQTVPEEETLLSLASGPFIQNPHIPAYQKQLSSFAIYHDVHVDQDAEMRKPAVTRAEQVVAADGHNLIHVLHTLYSTDRNFENDINMAMRAAFSDDFEKLVFPPDADQRIQLRLRWKSLKRAVSALDISDGTLRFLFLLTVLASPTPVPLIAIDEPETGLHPSMLPIIAEYAVEASTRAQVILTTHSAELLNAFSETRPMTTVAKWEDGETKLTQLGDKELGYWLNEYSLGALYASGQLEVMA
jgi:predicted ATPase